MENFNELLQKYADFIVRVGVNPQPGQTLIINCPLEGAPLARLCVRSAYEAGARDVQVNWQDDAVTRIRMELGSEDALTDHKGWQLRRYLDYAESEGSVCVLHLIADDPELFAGLDGAKISRVNSANRSFMQPWREYTMNDRVQWSIAAMPSAPWAKKMFPELDTDAAIEKLWQLIFDVCRVTGGDPVNEWKAHLDRLTSLGEKMNALDLESVHFESANGTDLTVGLAEKASWESAGSKNEKGVFFLPNIPTEEVFTAPHKDKVDGIVYGTKPYVFNGQLIKNFHVTFKDGKPFKAGYRKFKMKTVAGTDDYASLAETVSRRAAEYEKYAAQAENGQPSGNWFGQKPDLLLMDGGRGQVSAAKDALAGTALADVPLYGMVKDDHHRTRAIVDSDGREIAINMNRGTFTFITAIQDETHRFANAYRKQQMRKKSYSSTLTEVPGVGPKTAKALMTQFKSVGAGREGTPDQLENTPGVGPQLAQTIYDYFHA